jgi:hypothetical protein
LEQIKCVLLYGHYSNQESEQTLVLDQCLKWPCTDYPRVVSKLLGMTTSVPCVILSCQAKDSENIEWIRFGV